MLLQEWYCCDEIGKHKSGKFSGTFQIHELDNVMIRHNTIGTIELHELLISILDCPGVDSSELSDLY